MSHLKVKIGTAEPDKNGAVSVSLGDLDDVTIAGGVANNSGLRYVNNTWQDAEVVTGYEAAGYAAGWSTNTSGSATNSYTSTGSLNSYRTHDAANWENTSNSTQITAGGLDLDRGTEGGVTPTQTRFSRIVLDVGKYLLLATTMARSTNSNNYVEFQFRDTNTNTELGPRWRQYGAASKEIGRGIGYCEVSSGTRTVDIRVVAHSGTMYDNPHNFQDDLIAAIQIG